MHRTYIADIERGVRNITLRSIINLAAALQVSVSSLLAEPGETVHGPNDAPAASEVLLIEGNAQEAEQIVQALAEARFTNPVTTVRDGEEALEYLNRRGPAELPHLVLLDLKPGKLDGIDVLRRMRAQESTKSVPVVILAAARDERTLLECARLGADTVIVKPLTVEKLAGVLPRLNVRWAIRRANGHSAGPAPSA